MIRTLFMDQKLAWQYAEREAHAGKRVTVTPGASVGAPITVIVDQVDPEEFVAAVKQLCKDFSDLQDRPYMGDVYAQIDVLYAHMQEPQS